MQDEKMVTIYIDEYPRRCEESKVPSVLENVDKLKQMYLEKGIPQETLDKMYSVRIVKDEEKTTEVDWNEILPLGPIPELGAWKRKPTSSPS